METLSTIEKNDEHFARIKSLSNQEIKRINVKTARLDDILIKRGIEVVDFMTIDVEGHEMSVLSGMAFDVIAPRVLIIEDNSHGENSQVRDLMRTYSYVRFKRTGCNDWYINRRDPIVTSLETASTEARILLRVILRRIKSKVKKIIGFK